jgi:hypothetical protein
MKMLISVTWVILPYLTGISLVLMLCGVAWFGQHLVRTVSKQADDSKLWPLIWRGSATKLALKLFGAGVALQLLTIIAAAIIPGRN